MRRVTDRPASAASIRVAGDADVPAVAALMYEVAPEMALTAEELAHEDSLTPGGRRFLAEVDGELAGVGVASRFYAREAEFEGSWTTLQVHEPFRRRGIGSALLARIAEHAAVLGKGSLHMWTSEGRPEVGPWLARRGFAEHERAKYVALSLAGLRAARRGAAARRRAHHPRRAPGARRGDLRRGARGGGRHPVRRPVRPAVDRAVADVRHRPARSPARRLRRRAGRRARSWAGRAWACPAACPGVGYHNMTGVRRAWRGRGVAGALKRATIAWAIAKGLDVLETENDEANAPMRAINRRLGYRPLPDRVLMRAPLPLPRA